MPVGGLSITAMQVLGYQCEVVYSVKCSDCDKEYISEMGTTLGMRFRELTDGKHPNSAIMKQTSTTSYRYTMHVKRGQVVP